MLGKIVNGYTLTAFKGSGSFGSVYVCQKNNSTYAMKIFNSKIASASWTPAQ